MPTIGGLVTHPSHDAIVLHQLSNGSAHDQLEGGVPSGFGDQEFQELHLAHQRHVRETPARLAEVDDQRSLPHRGRNDAADPGVRDGLEQALGQTDLVQDGHDRRVNGVAAEIAIEIGVGLQQRRGNALPGQQQGQEHARRPAAGDTTGGLVDILNHVRMHWAERVFGLLPDINSHRRSAPSPGCRQNAPDGVPLQGRTSPTFDSHGHVIVLAPAAADAKDRGYAGIPPGDARAGRPPDRAPMPGATPPPLFTVGGHLFSRGVDALRNRSRASSRAAIPGRRAEPP